MADHSHAAEAAQGYEATDADVSPLFKFLAFLAVFIAISIFGVVILFKLLDYYQPLFDDPVPPMAAMRHDSAANAPRLEVDPPQQKIAWEAHEEQVLTSYGWNNKEAGIGRIPIDRAKALVAAGKLPIDLAGGTAP